MENKVIVEIIGGVGYVVKKPKGVAVEIHDYDIHEEDFNAEHCRQDEDGDTYWMAEDMDEDEEVGQ